MNLHSLRWRLVDAPDSWGVARRAHRAQWLVETFPDLARMSVIDLGGRVDTWVAMTVRPEHVHVVNLDTPPVDVPRWVEADFGDACALPDSIALRRYDLVFSNSVIEHVGGHERRMRFAETVHSLGDSHWVQTPYRYFPIEPHWLAPGMQFLPTQLRASVAYRWPLAHCQAQNQADALDSVLWTELIGRTQMQRYFPSATLRAERLLGLTKSLIAYRVGGS